MVVGNGWSHKVSEDMPSGILREGQFMFTVTLIVCWWAKSLMDLYLTIFVEIGLVLTLVTWSWLHSKRIYCEGLDWLHKPLLLLIARRDIPITRKIPMSIEVGVIVELVAGNEPQGMKRGQSVG